MGHAFHHTAVAGDDPDPAIHQIRLVQTGHCGKMFLCHGETASGCKAGPQRTGGDIHARGHAVFRMARRDAAPLTEVFDLIHRDAEVIQVQQAVKKHGAVTCGKNKTVPSQPCGIFRIDAEMVLPQRDRKVGTAHRHTGVSGLGFLDRIGGKDTDRIGGKFQFFRVSHAKTS